MTAPFDENVTEFALAHPEKVLGEREPSDLDPGSTALEPASPAARPPLAGRSTRGRRWILRPRGRTPNPEQLSIAWPEWYDARTLRLPGVR